jgi:hypothetical protein
VRNLGLSKETIARLEQPLMPNTDYAEVYRQRINQRFDERLAEAGHL